MATEEDLTLEIEAPEVELEVEAGETPEAAKVSTDGAEDDDDLSITFGDEQPEAEPEVDASAPEWVKNLRKEAKEQKRKIKDLEKQLEQTAKTAAPQVEDAGPEPDLADFSYDAEQFRAAHKDWVRKDLLAQEQRKKLQQEQEEKDREYQSRVQAYHERKIRLGVNDFEDAESVVTETLTPQQQGIIVHAVEKPEQLIYALGKYPSKAKELAAITDPIRFAFAVAKLEGQMKVSKRSKAPPPEKSVGSASAPLTASNLQARIDAALEKAQKTGDLTEYRALRAAQRKG